MKRGLFFCVVALLCGVYTAYLSPVAGLKTFLFWTVLGAGIAAVFIKKARVPFFIVLFFFTGVLQASHKDNIENRPLYPFQDEFVTITAEVIQEPERREEDGSHSLTVRVLHLSFLEEKAEIGEKAVITIKAGNQVPALGETFRAICRFNPPKDAMNTTGFNSARYLKSQDIFFRGLVENHSVSVVGEAKKTLAGRIYALNRRMGYKIEKLFPDDAGAVLKAMALGDSGGLSDSLRETLQVSGLSHMVSVSGMHVSILMMTLSSLMLLTGGSYRRRRVVLLLFIMFYMFFAGASPAVFRAAICSTLSILASFVRRKEDGLTSLGIAAGILLLMNPLVAFDAGFMLSFAAALGIVLFAEPAFEKLGLRAWEETKPSFLKRMYRTVMSYTIITVSAQVCLLPVSAYMFGYTSLWSFVTGLLVLPLGAVLMVGGLLVSLTGFVSGGLSVLCAGFLYPFVKLFLMITDCFGSINGGLLMLGTFSLFAIFSYILFLVLIQRLLHKRWRHAAAVCLSLVLLLGVYGTYRSHREELAKVTFINVGQGDCTLIRLQDGTDILIDGGGIPSYAGHYDVGTQIVLPYLRKAGIYNLDYVVATHGHEDHINGLMSLLAKIDVNTVLMPQGFGKTKAGEAFLSYVNNESIETRFLLAGEELSFSEGVYLDVLMPSKEWLTKTEDENERSLILRFRFGNARVLLMSDLGEEGEEYLTKTGTEGGAHIVKAGHHGSKTSTTEVFLDWATPHFVYIPCGENNFGHPADEMLDRCEKRGISLLRADEDKDVCFVLSKTGIRKIRKGGEMS